MIPTTKNLSAVSVILLLAACSPSPPITPTPDPCNLAETFDQENALAARFDDALWLADHTPDEQLADNIRELQEIRRDAMALEVPDCAFETHAAMVTAMNAWIDVYITRLDPDATDDDVSAKRDVAWGFYDAFAAQLEQLQDGTASSVRH